MSKIPRVGFSSMLKDGAKHFHGMDEAVFRNLEACKDIARITRSSYGPNGMDKMVINHLEKLFVTNDAATILKELEVQHPAAKLLVMACQMMQEEVGDGTNFVMVFGGALLQHAEGLLRMGLSPSEVISGYEKGLKKAQELLEGLTVSTVKDVTKLSDVLPVITTSVGSKQYGSEDVLAQLVTDACLSIVPENPKNFNVDNVRISKILGAGLHSSQVMKGLVFKRQVEGVVTEMKNAKVAVYSCPFDAQATETKGTVLIKSATELLEFNKGEESLIEEIVKGLSEGGFNVMVTGGKIGELALHFLDKYKIMAVRLLSKFDLRRVCRTVNATALPKMVVPTPEESGHCDAVEVAEIGDTNVVIFRQEAEESAISTIIIRGSTDNVMDDVERAVDDGVNTFKALTKDGRLVAGAGAVEVELAKELSKFSETCPGLEQYAIKKFSEALEDVVKALSENAGMNATEVLATLYSEHQSGKKNAGVRIMDNKNPVLDAVEAQIFDLFLTKSWGLKLATNAATTILRVDQIFMAKPAGGPKPRENREWDED
jgi:T-complex protein 1 subunit theta